MSGFARDIYGMPAGTVYPTTKRVFEKTREPDTPLTAGDYVSLVRKGRYDDPLAPAVDADKYLVRKCGAELNDDEIVYRLTKAAKAKGVNVLDLAASDIASAGGFDGGIAGYLRAERVVTNVAKAAADKAARKAAPRPTVGATAMALKVARR